MVVPQTTTTNKDGNGIVSIITKFNDLLCAEVGQLQDDFDSDDRADDEDEYVAFPGCCDDRIDDFEEDYDTDYGEMSSIRRFQRQRQRGGVRYLRRLASTETRDSCAATSIESESLSRRNLRLKPVSSLGTAEEDDSTVAKSSASPPSTKTMSARVALMLAERETIMADPIVGSDDHINASSGSESRTRARVSRPVLDSTNTEFSATTVEEDNHILSSQPSRRPGGNQDASYYEAATTLEQEQETNITTTPSRSDASVVVHVTDDEKESQPSPSSSVHGVVHTKIAADSSLPSSARETVSTLPDINDEDVFAGIYADDTLNGSDVFDDISISDHHRHHHVSNSSYHQKMSFASSHDNNNGVDGIYNIEENNDIDDSTSNHLHHLTLTSPLAVSATAVAAAAPLNTIALRARRGKRPVRYREKEAYIRTYGGKRSAIHRSSTASHHGLGSSSSHHLRKATTTTTSPTSTTPQRKKKTTPTPLSIATTTATSNYNKIGERSGLQTKTGSTTINNNTTTTTTTTHMHAPETTRQERKARWMRAKAAARRRNLNRKKTMSGQRVVGVGNIMRKKTRKYSWEEIKFHLLEEMFLLLVLHCIEQNTPAFLYFLLCWYATTNKTATTSKTTTTKLEEAKTTRIPLLYRISPPCPTSTPTPTPTTKSNSNSMGECRSGGAKTRTTTTKMAMELLATTQRTKYSMDDSCIRRIVKDDDDDDSDDDYQENANKGSKMDRTTNSRSNGNSNSNSTTSTAPPMETSSTRKTNYEYYRSTTSSARVRKSRRRTKKWHTG